MEKTSKPSLGQLQSGQVTAVGQRTIRISGVEYPLDFEVVVTDDEGRSRDLREVQPESEVMFSLRQARVDRIVLVLPK